MASQDLPGIGSRYKTVLTRFQTTVVNQFQQIVASNPMRIFIRFLSLDGDQLNYLILPGQVTVGGAEPAMVLSINRECKFVDAPSSCIGDWYARGGTTIRILVEEVIRIPG
jgi:hypothetical protein